MTSAIAATVRQKIWIDEWADPTTALDGRWPPVAASPRPNNIAALLGVVPATMIPVTSALLVMNRPDGCALFLSAMAGALPAAWISYRIAAKSQAECYPEETHPRAHSLDPESFDSANG